MQSSEPPKKSILDKPKPTSSSRSSSSSFSCSSGASSADIMGDSMIASGGPAMI